MFQQVNDIIARLPVLPSLDLVRTNLKSVAEQSGTFTGAAITLAIGAPIYIWPRTAIPPAPPLLKMKQRSAMSDKME